MYLSFKKNYGLDISIARYHNIFGPEGTWQGWKRESSCSYMERYSQAIQVNGSIEIFGTGIQTRSFLYIDECIEATIKLTRSDFSGPVNIGSEEMKSINNLAKRY